MSKQLFSQTRGQGPDLLMLHGWGLNSGVWESIAPELQKHYRVTYLDLPGFGRNADWLPAAYTLESVTEVVAAQLTKPTWVLGWSMGGLVAQSLASRYPHHVRGLVLVASTPRFVQAADWPGIRPEVLSAFESQLERDFVKTLDRFLAIQALGSPSAKGDIHTIRQQIQNYPLPSDIALRAGLAILAETDLRLEISRVACPVARFYGRLDSLVPGSAVEKIEAIAPSDCLEVFEKASHAPFISHPSAFVKALIGALQRLP